MRCKVYDCDGYKIHAIKTDKYRTSTINVCFRKELKKEDISSYTILARLLTHSCKKYSSRREMSIELERLYSSVIYASSNIEGNTLNFDVTYDFLNPKYCEKGYLDEVIEFLFEVINHPNARDGKFLEDPYNICINLFKSMIEEEKEYVNSYSLRRSLECMDSKSPISYSSLGYLEDLDKIDPSTLYKSYKKLFTDFKIDIYVSGNIDMDLVIDYIKKYFIIKNSMNSYGNIYASVSTRKEVNEVVEYGDYEQASFIMLYNMIDLTKREKEVVLPIFNSIFGSNELTSKLYSNVREKNSLCYNISSYFMKLNGVLVVKAGIDQKNKEKCIKLVDKCLKEMVNGKFSDEDVLCAKKTRINQVKMREDSTWALINIQIGIDLTNEISGNRLINEFKTVTKKEVVNLAKKIKLNTIYMLCKEGN